MKEPVLGYNPLANVGEVVRKKSNGIAYNTTLDTGKMHVQACCKCFGRQTQGSCAGHYAEIYLRETTAHSILLEVDEKLEALQKAFAALGQVNLRSEGDSRGFMHALEEVLALRSVAPEKLRPKERKP